MRRPLCEKSDFNQNESFTMRSFRNTLVLALAEFFRQSDGVSESPLGGRGRTGWSSDHPALYQQEKGDAGIIQFLLLVINLQTACENRP